MKKVLNGILILVMVAAFVLPPLTVFAANELSEEEVRSLLLMREEEKLARDVYSKFCDLYQDRIFCNIKVSEQRHMDAVKGVLDRYGIADPAQGKNPGEFTNPDLQKLYTTLMARGNQSLVEALNVGVEIELKDIADLQAGQTVARHFDYTRLIRASHNHLNAFQSRLGR